MTFVGLDLHKRYITLCAIDETGTVLAEVRRMPVSIEALTDVLSGSIVISASTRACERDKHPRAMAWNALESALEATNR